MYIVSKHFGFVLVFETKEQLATIVEQLQGMLEAANKSIFDPPYTYSFYADGKMDENSMEKELKKLKRQLS